MGILCAELPIQNPCRIHESTRRAYLLCFLWHELSPFTFNTLFPKNSWRPLNARENTFHRLPKYFFCFRDSSTKHMLGRNLHLNLLDIYQGRNICQIQLYFKFQAQIWSGSWTTLSIYSFDKARPSSRLRGLGVRGHISFISYLSVMKMPGCYDSFRYGNLVASWW